jgi:hypothetical protein
MASKTIFHQAVKVPWMRLELIANPIKTLVLGSFNPFKSDETSLDYYYGRPGTEFWRSIARNFKKPELFFTKLEPWENASSKSELLDRKLRVMDANSFCCLDVISEIKFTSNDQEILDHFVETRVTIKFS